MIGFFRSSAALQTLPKHLLLSGELVSLLQTGPRDREFLATRDTLLHNGTQL